MTHDPAGPFDSSGSPGSKATTPARSLRLELRRDWPYVLVAVAVLLLTVYRAATTSITYDEAETYLRYVERTRHSDPQALAGFLSVHRANNHPLNTLLIDITTALFPYREVAIRFPNLVMGGAYLWLAIAVSRRFANRPLVFGLLALNYSLAEFFGLARGYALSAGLVLAALSVWPDEGNGVRPLRVSLWLLLLASLANYVAVALLAAVCLEVVRSHGPRFLVRSLRSPGTLAGLVLLGWVLYALVAVSEDGKPLVGDSDRHFWDPMVGSHARMFAPDWNAPFPMLVGLGVAVMALLFVPLLARVQGFHYGRCLLVLTVIVTAASHLLSRPMPSGRVLLPFWPLVALAIGEAADFHARWLVGRWPRLARLVPVANGILLAALLVNFGHQADPTSTREWRSDYRRGAAIRDALARGDCVRQRRLEPHPVVDFYLKKFGRTRADPSLVCPDSSGLTAGASVSLL